MPLLDAQALAHYPVLAAMLTPALFMTASGTLLTNANNRLARISDRLRAEADGTDTPQQRAERLAMLQKRAVVILHAIRMLQLAIAMFVATSLAIAADAVAHLEMPWLPTGMALIGVALLLGGTLAMWREANLAVASLRLMASRLAAKVARDGGTSADPG